VIDLFQFIFTAELQSNEPFKR